MAAIFSLLVPCLFPFAFDFVIGLCMERGRGSGRTVVPNLLGIRSLNLFKLLLETLNQDLYPRGIQLRQRNVIIVIKRLIDIIRKFLKTDEIRDQMIGFCNCNLGKQLTAFFSVVVEVDVTCSSETLAVTKRKSVGCSGG